MLCLYHHPMSAASRFVRLVLAEYEQSTEFIEEKVWERRAEFFELNAAGEIPVLVEEPNLPVVGYYAIGEYLDESRGAMKREKRLLGDDPHSRAESRRLLDWALGKFDREVTQYLVRERVLKRQMTLEQGGGAPDSSAIRVARTNLKYHLKYFNWLAETRDWLAGEAISYGDLGIAAGLSVLDYMGEVPWEDGPALKEWYARIKSRPSFRPLLSDKIRGLPPTSHYVDLDF